MVMSAWLLAMVIVLFFEGAMIGIAPDTWKRSMRQLTEMPSATLRKIGLTMAAVAVAILLFGMTLGQS
ncbi:DUF2065 domain-containing protein [Cardiobacteriaceae bacterium TAE3-ERU3]|nr:DUF2065 domain-containing protein [Cardiobacteriaceae bacterium TAE3-ERU3]